MSGNLTFKRWWGAVIILLITMFMATAILAVPAVSNGKSTAVVLKAGDQGITTASALNVRSGPSTKYGVLQVVKKGTALEVIAQSGNWYKVSCKGKVGYVHSNYIIAGKTAAVTTPLAEKKSSPPASLTISAAASLTEAMNEIQKIYTAENPQVTLTMNYGSSGSLQQQIEQGAPADVFISAATKQMDALDKKDLIIKETRKNLLKNRMVLVVPKDSSKIKDFDDLSKARVIALGEPDSVPAGKYAKEILSKLKMWDTVQDKAVYAKDVRQVLAYVESGDADAGIVYRTDALISDKVKVVTLADEKLHSPVVYPAAVINSSKSPAAAKAFVNFLNGSKASQIFDKYGFTVIN